MAKRFSVDKVQHERIAKSTSLGRRPKTSSMNKNKKELGKNIMLKVVSLLVAILLAGCSKDVSFDPVQTGNKLIKTDVKKQQIKHETYNRLH